MREYTRAKSSQEADRDRKAPLWYRFRDRRMKGMKFRRQHPIDGYVVDFYCPGARLAVELDGGGHTEKKQKSYDREREKPLAFMG